MSFNRFVGKSALLSVLPLFFLGSCHQASDWAYQAEPRRGMKAAEIACESKRQLNGMRLQVIKTQQELQGLLGIFFSKFTVDQNFCTTINLRSGEIRESYKARCMEGRQRCILPQEALVRIRQQLEKGEDVVLHTKREMLKLEPADFAKLYRKLEKI